MFFAIGWVVVLSSREPYRRLEGFTGTALEDEIDDEVDRADKILYERVQQFLAEFSAPDLDWHFQPYMNNDRGILLFSTSRNRRGTEPSCLRVLRWIRDHGPGSYGIVYVHDAEDSAARRGLSADASRDYGNEHRVWRLARGQIEEVDDPFLSPIIPNLRPPGS